jgi:small-conductance mechanosensitive channel
MNTGKKFSKEQVVEIYCNMLELSKNFKTPSVMHRLAGSFLEENNATEIDVIQWKDEIRYENFISRIIYFCILVVLIILVSFFIYKFNKG